MFVNTSNVVSRLVTINVQAIITAIVISAMNLLELTSVIIQGLHDSNVLWVIIKAVSQPPSARLGHLDSESWSMLCSRLGFPRR